MAEKKPLCQYGEVTKELQDGDTLPGGASPHPEFVASGAITSAGIPLALNSDDTVSIVESHLVEFGLADTGIFQNSAVSLVSSVYDPVSGKMVVFYRDHGNGYVGTARVITVTETSMSFGAPVVFKNSFMLSIGAEYDAYSNQIILAYATNLPESEIVTVSVSGDSVTFGTPTTILPSEKIGEYPDLSVSTTDGTALMMFNDSAGNTKVVTLSIGAGSVTVNTPVLFPFNSVAGKFSLSFDPGSGNFLAAASDKARSDNSYIFIVSVSSNVPAFSTETFNVGAWINFNILVYDSINSKHILSYKNNTGGGSSRIVYISGGSIVLGAITNFTSGSINALDATYDTVNDKLIIATRNWTNGSFAEAYTGRIVADAVQFDGFLDLGPASAYYPSVSVVPSIGRSVFFLSDSNDLDLGKSYLLISKSGIVSNAKDFVGFSQSAAINTEVVQVAPIYSVDENQSGLNKGVGYWLDHDGALITASAGYPKAGTGLSSTKMIVGV